MIDTDILQRGDKLMHGGDVVQVLSISKTSLRVYNITKDLFLPKWVEAKEFEYLEVSPMTVSVVMDEVIKEVELKYSHEYKKFLELWRLSER